MNSHQKKPLPTMKTESQEKQILRDLQTGIAITAMDALYNYGCARLASRISKLRKEGFDIKREMITVDTRNGRGAKVARYYMTPELKPKQGVDFVANNPVFI